MNYYTLIYKLAEDYIERREKYRAEHLDMAKHSFDHGDLVLGGALSDPFDQALLVFKGKDDSVVRVFAENDPYVLNGLVEEWIVRKWNVVIGN